MEKVYLRLVELGSRTLDQVPEQHRERVKIMLEQNKENKNDKITK